MHDSDVLYVGTDDGALWVTKNGGHEWTDLWAITSESLAEAAREKAEDESDDDSEEG